MNTIRKTTRSTKKLTQDEFIAKANITHKGKYDYSKVVYENCFTKVKIICPEHGEFEQRPNNHCAGQGCPKCINKHYNNLSNTKEFVKRAKLLHGTNYGYEKVVYVSSTTPVKIICPIHGEFEQKPADHLQGRRCPTCYKEFYINKPFTTEEFIKRARQTHGDKYNYDKVNYVKSNKKVIITCPKHGDFEQMPNSHIHGYECRKCSLIKTTKEEFISSAKEIHGDKYNYDKVEYDGRNAEVTITCPKHGDFIITPTSHLNGRGCKLCKKENKRTSSLKNVLKQKTKRKYHAKTLREQIKQLKEKIRQLEENKTSQVETLKT